MFPYENSVSLWFLTTCSLKRFMSGNSDNSVETVLIIGGTCTPWQKPCSKRGFTLKLALYTLFRHENSVQSCIIGVCLLRLNRPVTMKIPLMKITFMEMSDSH